MPKIHIEKPTVHIHIGAQAPTGIPSLGLALVQACLAGSDAELQDQDAATAPAGLPAIGEYWPGQGGVYIAKLPALHHLPERHLILATEEKDGLAWGQGGKEVPGADSQHDGHANTQALLQHGDHPAAAWAAAHQADGHSDFYLPSRLELLMCWLAAPQLFKKDGWYWSSSQFSRSHAWCQGFERGGSYGSGVKDNELRARPVRTIHL